jgi:hypothetical protein
LKKVETTDGIRVLVYSEGKENKERSIMNKRKQRFLEAAGVYLNFMDTPKRREQPPLSSMPYRVP